MAWDGSDLPGLVPGGLTTNRARAPSDGSVESRPYAVLTVRKGRDPIFSSSCVLDFRLVTVDLYGVGADDLGAVVDTLHATYDSPATLDFSSAPKVQGHVRTEPYVDEVSEVDEAPPGGTEMRHERVQWMVWTQRAY